MDTGMSLNNPMTFALDARAGQFRSSALFGHETRACWVGPISTPIRAGTYAWRVVLGQPNPQYSSALGIGPEV